MIEKRLAIFSPTSMSGQYLEENMAICKSLYCFGIQFRCHFVNAWRPTIEGTTNKTVNARSDLKYKNMLSAYSASTASALYASAWLCANMFRNISKEIKSKKLWKTAQPS